MQHIKKFLIFLFITISISLIISTYANAQEPSSADTTEGLYSSSSDRIAVAEVQTGSKTALVNGKKLTLDTAVINTNKKLLAPVKFLANILGASYEFNPKSKIITVSKDDILIVFQLNKNTSYLNGKKVITDTAPVLSGTTVLIPVGFTVQSLGATYEWNEKLKTAYIKQLIKTVLFTDIYLENAVRLKVNKPKGIIFLSDVCNISSLQLADKRITNLNGLQNFTGLKELSVAGTNISDLSPIIGLINLKTLVLNDNRIKDITPLKKLINLTYLDLTNNQLMDASVLGSLNMLTTVKLWDNSSKDEILRLNNAARDIVSEVIKPGMTDFQKELYLHDYLVTHIKYDKQNYDNLSLTSDDHNASGFFFYKTGVCDAYAKAYKILLNRIGIEAYVVYGDMIGPKDSGYEDFGHAWNIVRIDGNYYHVDPTFDDPIDPETLAKDVLVHKYFNLSDKQMSLSHTWNRSEYPACNIDNEVYYQSIKSNREIISTENYNYGVFNNKLYKYKSDGSEIKRLSEDNLKYINLVNDYIYYMNIGDNSKIYRIRTDGSEKTLIIDEPSLFPYAYGDYLYYINKSSSKLTRARLDGTEKSTMGITSYVSYFDIQNGLIYYRGFDWSLGSKLYKAGIDLSGRIPIIDEALEGFDLSDNSRELGIHFSNYEEYFGDYIFYISKLNGNKIMRIKTDGTDKIVLNNSKSSELEYFGGYIYYVNNNDNKYYRIKADGTGTEELIG